MKNRYISLTVLGGIVSVTLLYFALRDMDWQALWLTLVGVKVVPFMFCALMILLGIVLRGWRWNLIAGSPLSEVIIFARATNLGLLGNQLLPARLGEIVRVIALKRMLGSGLSKSVGSALIDRMFDVAALFISAWLVSASVAKDFLPRGWVDGLGLTLAGLVVLLFIVRTRGFHHWLTKRSERWLHQWSLRPDSFIVVFNAMVGRLMRLHNGLAVIGVGLAVWLSDYLAVFAALWSMGLDLPLVAPLFLWVMLAAGSALPSAPGYLGIYQIAAVLALGAYGVPAHEAVAASLVLQLLALLMSLMGAGNEAWRLLSIGGLHSTAIESENEKSAAK